MEGTVAVGLAPQQNDGAPSAVGLVIGTPSPTASDHTGYQPTGNSSSYSDSFTNFISGLAKKTVGAVTAAENKVKYKGDVILGTITKGYYQTVAGVAGAVADTAQGAKTVVEKVQTTSTLLVVGILLFLAFPYIMAMRKK